VDDVVVIAGGRLRASGPLDTVLGADQETTTFVRTDAVEQLSRLLEEEYVLVERDGSDALIVQGASPQRVGAIAAEHRVALVELRPQTRSLEEAFLTLTGSQP
jgi:ABC-2 type transport system ATP-binding protein